MKITTILGTRPQFIKVGSICLEISRQPDIQVNIKEVIIHTEQNYDSNMSDLFLDEIQILKPDYFLGMGGNIYSTMAGQMTEKIISYG